MLVFILYIKHYLVLNGVEKYGIRIRLLLRKKSKCKKCSCLEVIAAIVGALFALVIGVIIGAELASTILGALAAVIVLAIVLGLLLIITVILIICKNLFKHKMNIC